MGNICCAPTEQPEMREHLEPTDQVSKEIVQSQSSLVTDGTLRSLDTVSATTAGQIEYAHHDHRTRVDEIEWIDYTVSSWPVKFIAVQSFDGIERHTLELLETRWKTLRVHDIILNGHRDRIIGFDIPRELRQMVDQFLSDTGEPTSFEYTPKPVPNSYNLIQSIEYTTPSNSIKLLNIFCDEDDVRSKPARSPSIGSKSRESLLIPGKHGNASPNTLPLTTTQFRPSGDSGSTHDFLARVYDFQDGVSITDISFGITGTSSRDFLSSKANWVHETCFIYGNYWYNLSGNAQQQHKFFDLSESHRIFETPNCYRIFQVCPKLQWIIGAYFEYSGSRLGKPYELVVVKYTQNIGDQNDLETCEPPQFEQIVSIEDYNATYVPFVERMDDEESGECLLWVGKKLSKASKHSSSRKSKWRENCHKRELIRIFFDDERETYRYETLFRLFIDARLVDAEPIFQFWGDAHVTFPFKDRVYAINFLLVEQEKIFLLLSPFVNSESYIVREIISFLPKELSLHELRYLFNDFGKDGRNHAMKIACGSFENNGHAFCIALPEAESENIGQETHCQIGFADRMSVFLDEELQVFYNHDSSLCGPENAFPLNQYVAVTHNQLKESPPSLVFWKQDAP